MNRNLSPNVAKGMFGGPRGIKGGDYIRGNVGQTSGGDAYSHPTSVNGNLDTVRKPVKNGKIKK
jgi:hypothetical protein